jgi:hypothetical protein
MKLLAAVPLALALLISAAGQANAGGPTRMFLPAPPFIIVDNSCSFDVRIDFVRNAEYIIVFTDPSGEPTRGIITGALVQRFTNVESGKSIVVNASGPAFIGNDSLVLGGRSTIFIPGRLFLSAGRVQFDATGNLTGVTGKTTDLCAALS